MLACLILSTVAADGLGFKPQPISAQYIFIAGDQPAVALPFVAVEANMDGIANHILLEFARPGLSQSSMLIKSSPLGNISF